MLSKCRKSGRFWQRQDSLSARSWALERQTNPAAGAKPAGVEIQPFRAVSRQAYFRPAVSRLEGDSEKTSETKRQRTTQVEAKWAFLEFGRARSAERELVVISVISSVSVRKIEGPP